MSGGGGGLDTRCGVFIRGLWEIQADYITYVRFGDSVVDNHKYEPMDKILDCWEKDNKDKYSKHYHE